MGRHPVGTTRSGQFFIGLACTMAGTGSALGLYLFPRTFDLVVAVMLGAMSRGHLAYDPSDRPFYAVLLVLLGLLGGALFAHAFLRQPTIDRQIDRVIKDRDLIDQSRRSTMITQDDPGE